MGGGKPYFPIGFNHFRIGRGCKWGNMGKIIKKWGLSNQILAHFDYGYTQLLIKLTWRFSTISQQCKVKILSILFVSDKKDCSEIHN